LFVEVSSDPLVNAPELTSTFDFPEVKESTALVAETGIIFRAIQAMGGQDGGDFPACETKGSIAENKQIVFAKFFITNSLFNYTLKKKAEIKVKYSSNKKSPPQLGQAIHSNTII